MKTYQYGDVVRVSAVFKNSAGTAIDPTSVYGQYKHQSASQATVLTYGTDAGLVRDSAGNYHFDIDANLPGIWYYRVYSTGTGKAAATGSFKVERSPI